MEPLNWPSMDDLVVREHLDAAATFQRQPQPHLTHGKLERAFKRETFPARIVSKWRAFSAAGKLLDIRSLDSYAAALKVFA